MAADDSNEEVIEIDTSRLDLCGEIHWACKGATLLKYFFNCERGDVICSNEIQVSFQLYDETIKTIWYLEICPNGYKEEQKGSCNVFLALASLKRAAKTAIELKAIYVSRRIMIPQIGFRYSRRNSRIKSFNSDHGLGLGRHGAKIERFKQFDVENLGGFDLIVSFSIDKIDLIIKSGDNNNINNNINNSNEKLHNGNMKEEKDNIYSNIKSESKMLNAIKFNSVDYKIHSAMLQQLMKKMDDMEEKMSTMQNQMTKLIEKVDSGSSETIDEINTNEKNNTNLENDSNSNDVTS